MVLERNSIENCVEKIRKYLASENLNKPFFVDVENQADYEIICSMLSQRTIVKNISSFCSSNDVNPKLDEIIEVIRHTDKNISIIGLTQYVKLLGDRELRKSLSLLMGTTTCKKVVIICYQIDSYLEDLYANDLRVDRQICLTDGVRSTSVQLTFTNKELNLKNTLIDGIQGAIIALEENKSNLIIVSSTKRKRDFPLSLLPISEIMGVYEALTISKYPFMQNLEKHNGSDSQWGFLLNQLNTGKKINQIMEENLTACTHFDLLFSKWNSFDKTQKWLYFIALKINGSNGNKAIEKAIEKAHSVEEFIPALFKSILDMTPMSSDYRATYRERKDLIIQIDVDTSIIVEYCNFAEIKGADEIYYLTDNTQYEKEKIIECLSSYDYNAQEITKILKIVYPDLAKYLSKFNFNIPLLDSYFQEYKLQKITNKINNEFLQMVNKNAKTREYNAVLPYRSEKVEAIDKKNALLYFVDALGVEYLGYIMDKCNDYGMSAKVTVCHSNLPSITAVNKEFLLEFDNSIVKSIKDLDEIKHHGKDDFDYQKTKYPIHLTKELDIINGFLDNANSKLTAEECEKVIVISDHGASRLAVINEEVYDFDVDSKGTHGGRCCAYNDNLPEIPYATREGDFYVLASYDRFKGGRAASVETHGGATLEEVVVPIIELKKKSSNIVIQFVDNVVKVSMRKKAEITVFSSAKLENLSICVNDKYYQGERIEDRKYLVHMPDIRRTGIYIADVYSDNNLIVSGLSFSIEKEGFAEKDLF